MKDKNKNKVVDSGFKYEISELLENCENITKHKRDVGEGALSGSSKEKMTVSEFKELVNIFLKKEVK